MKKRMMCVLLALMLVLTGCGSGAAEPETTIPEVLADPDTVVIQLENGQVLMEEGVGVSVANDIIYYESGHDFTYGEGEPGDEHDKAEADAHTVVHITQPGTYRISGKLEKGQIAVDLGSDAKKDSDAVVTLILDGVDITCTVAPAVIFYNVYECGSKDEETATANVDTSAAGANVILADGSENTVRGAYVARIYKPDSVVLSADGKSVEEAKKLHKYDAAFYSKMSMNISGGEIGDGILNIYAENEGLDSELHLTINGGDIRIESGNDGINTNEDGISVTTINGGSLQILVNGATGEGDGIDSNGWLVINGGYVTAQGCGFSMDAGIDSDMGIYINGGTMMASGNMLDHIAGGDATYAVFQLNGTRKAGTYTLKDTEGREVLRYAPVNNFSYLVVSSRDLVPGTYTLWQGNEQLSGSAGSGGMGFGGMDFGGMAPGNFQPPEGDFQIPGQPGMPMEPQGSAPNMPEGGMPGGFDPNGEMPEGFNPGQGGFGGGQGGFSGGFPGGMSGGMQGGNPQTGETSGEFQIGTGENYFKIYN